MALNLPYEVNGVDLATEASTTSSRLHKRSSSSPTKLNLAIRSVIGTTASSPSGFTCVSKAGCYAICVGSAVVVGYVDGDLNVKQRTFRATPELTTHSNPVSNGHISAPSTPDFRNRAKISLGYPNQAPRPFVTPQTNAASIPGKGALRTRTRSVTCVACSQDGRILALGETGFSPRILLFSMQDDELNVPYAVLSEHFTGICGLSFSKDGRWLCSVGDIHDGSVLLWSVGATKSAPTRLYARNKCNSYIHDITWIGNELIVTVGTRHVKVWRPDPLYPPLSPSKGKPRSEPTDSPLTPRSSKALSGRNALLGSLLDSCFTSVIALAGSTAVVASNRGEICLLDTSLSTQTLSVLHVFDGSISCMAVTKASEVWIGILKHNAGTVHRLSLEVAENTNDLQRKEGCNGCRATEELRISPGPVAMGFIHDNIICLDSERTIQAFGTCDHGTELDSAPRKRFWCHRGPVMGVCRGEAEPLSIVTWDSTGLVCSWSLPDGEHLSSHLVKLNSVSEAEGPNELRVLRFIKAFYNPPHKQMTVEGQEDFKNKVSLAVCGDKHGILKLLDPRWEELASIKAHEGEINDILCHGLDSVILILSAGRDRTIQVFRSLEDGEPIHLLQTLDIHGSSVNKLLFHEINKALLSASSDRTITISTLVNTENAMAFVPTRVITLKQTPVGMALDTERPNNLLVTTTDKQIQRYDLLTCHPIETIRLSDDNGGGVAIGHITHLVVGTGDSRQGVILGASSTDRSVRIHCVSSGKLLVKDFAHADGISGLAVFANIYPRDAPQPLMVSTGLDGTIILWTVKEETFQAQDSINSSDVRTTNRTLPLRRVLSRTTLSGFSKCFEAKEQSPPCSTPIRLRSPTRLRKKRSEYSLAGTRRGVYGTSVQDRSPSPSTPSDSRYEGARPSFTKKQRAQSIEDFRNVAPSAEQLSKALRRFRKHLTQNPAKDERLKELELELYLTQELVNRRPNTNNT